MSISAMLPSNSMPPPARPMFTTLEPDHNSDEPNRQDSAVKPRNFLERLWSVVLPYIKDSLILNCFQLYAPSVVKDYTIEKWFFIDQTLLQLFDHYGQRSTIGRRIAREAIE